MISGNRVVLSSKSLSDAPRDYAWQKDAGLMALNGSIPITMSFFQYLARYTSGQQRPNVQFFSIKTIKEGQHIGNCAVYDIDRSKEEASIGILIGEKDYWGQGYGMDSVKTLSGYIFNEMGFKRINLKTLETNTRALRCFTKCGFSICGKLSEKGSKYILMQLSRDDYVRQELAAAGL